MINGWLETHEMLPPWLLTLLAAGISVWLVHVFRTDRRRFSPTVSVTLFALRAAAFFVLGAMFLQVTYVEDRTPPDTVIFVLDDSASMRELSADDHFYTAQNSPAVTRHDALHALLADPELALETRLKTHVDVKTVTLSELMTKQPENMHTPLAAATHKILTGNIPHHRNRELTPLGSASPQAIIFFTDGAATDADAFAREAESAARRGMSLDTVIFGTAAPLPRLQMSITHAETELAVGDELNVRCTLTAENLSGRRAEIILRDADHPQNILARAEYTFSEKSHETAEIHVKWQPAHPGEYACTLEAKIADTPPLPPHYARFLHTEKKLSVSVTDRKYRVFLAWQKPSWEFRYLLNLLAREKSLEVAYWLGTAEPGYVAQDAAARERFPEPAELDAVDVLILGDVAPALLGENAVHNIMEWLAGQNAENAETQRALMCVAGPAYTFRHWRGTELEKLLPFYAADVKFTQNALPGAKFVPTPLGATTPGVGSVMETDAYEKFPLIHQFQELPRLSPAAMILAELHVLEAENKPARKVPATILFPGPHGKILIHTHDSTWRWRWRDDETAYRHYWLQTLRWLCRGADVRDVPEDAKTSQAAEITLSAAAAKTPTDTAAEFRTTAANPALMQKIATLTGGTVYGTSPAHHADLRPVQYLPRDLLFSLQTARQTPTESAPRDEYRLPLWRHGATLLLLCALLFTQWAILRRVA